MGYHSKVHESESIIVLYPQPCHLTIYVMSRHVMCLLTLLPFYSPSHTGSQTQPADPPSGCISGRPSLRLHGNRGHMGAARPSSGGTSSAARNHSVSKGYQHQY